jgi:hypothetical protein
MTRTIKDKPIWAILNNPANRFGEDHNCGIRGRVCDIDVPRTATDKYRYCQYLLDPDSAAARQWSRWWTRRNHTADVHFYYWQPERANTRAVTTRIARAHRSGSDLDDIAGLDDLYQQHHHTPFNGGWWD